MNLETLPEHPGGYALILSLSTPRHLRVGRLGEAVFPGGVYVCCGSARNPGGIRARLGRHLHNKRSNPHSHIDYLRRCTDVLGACWLNAQSVDVRSDQSVPDSLECRWSKALIKIPSACIPVPGFGSSDYRSGCVSHLVVFKNIPREQPDPGMISLPVSFRQIFAVAADVLPAQTHCICGKIG